MLGAFLFKYPHNYQIIFKILYFYDSIKEIFNNLKLKVFMMKGKWGQNEKDYINNIVTDGGNVNVCGIGR